MRTTGLLGLAVSAMLTIAAFAGPGSASAVSLCSINQNPCPEGNVYPAETALGTELAMPTTLVTAGEVLSVTCTASALTGETLSASGASVEAEITALTFGGCLDSNENMCAMAGINLPYEALFYEPSGGNGRLAVPMGEGGAPSLQVQCGMLTCVYGAGLKFQVNGGQGAEPPTLELLTETLNRQMGSGFLCPETATWTAEYTVTAPESLYVVANP